MYKIHQICYQHSILQNKVQTFEHNRQQTKNINYPWMYSLSPYENKISAFLSYTYPKITIPYFSPFHFVSRSRKPLIVIFHLHLFLFIKSQNLSIMHNMPQNIKVKIDVFFSQIGNRIKKRIESKETTIINKGGYNRIKKTKIESIVNSKQKKNLNL